MPRLARTLALCALAASTGGCTAGRKSTDTGAVAPATSPTAPCDGQRYLIVDNQTAGNVDVVVVPASTGVFQVLTTARPGRQRIALAEPVLRAFARQEGGGERVSGGRGRRRGNDVTFSYACER